MDNSQAARPPPATTTNKIPIIIGRMMELSSVVVGTVVIGFEMAGVLVALGG